MEQFANAKETCQNQMEAGNNKEFNPGLGPVVAGVLLTQDLSSTIQAYQQYLAVSITRRFTLDELTAEVMTLNQLSGKPCAMLAGESGREWLLIIEATDAIKRDSLRTHGWMAQEILVQDVDTLVAGLENSPFDVLRPPADLDVSDRIRASQVRGPAGEILYLTQVKGEVPPFELPSCQARVDHLFIPVLSTPDRDGSLAEYEALAAQQGLRFDTRISVVNQAIGLPMQQKHPVATLQLRGKALIEMDSIEAAVAPPPGLCSGTVAILFQAQGKPPANAKKLTLGPFAGNIMHAFRGRAGEISGLLYSS
ncbi:MAG: hypothetical protein OXD01_06715 [Gammaproteobacteria bacterium]|nr:hypothetical protein [Gammaproteobacteria bacterium]